MSKEEEYEGHQESIKEWGLKLFKKEYNGKVLGSQFLFIEEE